MTLNTEKGKAFALKELQKRRKRNEGREKIDNGSLRAGSPMYFYCITCGEVIVVPEDYTSRPKLCPECRALKDLGWLE